ncbi:hypothetical protein BBJ28_00009116 [Nothophytophthora sp. Chile5]|nr:hypothetical protein BBJ28_00009116 [Nothophytophthora sp. Chile5]
MEELLHDVEDTCDQLPEFNAVDRPVYSRLWDVYEQLVSVPAPLPVSLVESFSLLLWRFFVLLEQRADRFSSAASLCVSRTVANRNYSLHREIDRLLLSSSSLQDAAEVHRWQLSWKQTQLMQLDAMQQFLAAPLSVLNQLKSDDEHAEAMTLLQAEACDYHCAYSAAAPCTTGNADVVVKQLSSDSLDKASREQFRREADIWFNLNHSNLITMYGACYESRPFFVCERAHRKNLVVSAKEQLQLKVWGWLCQAALGLQHLHDRGIVHGDLKGNNILICDGVYETAKLTDIGLSMFADQPESPRGEGVLGAIRWKSPECLLGSRPTFKSDIFSFGMCTIEVKTGQFPWGTALPDSAIQFSVTHGSTLPQRPDNFEDREWGLMERMCCFDPDDRISVGAVVNILRVFAAENAPASNSFDDRFDDALDDSN